VGTDQDTLQQALNVISAVTSIEYDMSFDPFFEQYCADIEDGNGLKLKLLLVA